MSHDKSPVGTGTDSSTCSGGWDAGEEPCKIFGIRRNLVCLGERKKLRDSGTEQAVAVEHLHSSGS